jgi:hypothetical protein
MNEKNALYNLLSAILIAALVCDFVWVITTALNAH